MKEFKKVDYTKYKDKYDEDVKLKLHTSPADIDTDRSSFIS